jgi:hypothetical protein
MRPFSSVGNLLLHFELLLHKTRRFIAQEKDKLVEFGRIS